MTPLETEANPNIRVGPLRWGRPVVVSILHEMKDKLISRRKIVL